MFKNTTFNKNNIGFKNLIVYNSWYLKLIIVFQKKMYIFKILLYTLHKLVYINLDKKLFLLSLNFKLSHLNNFAWFLWQLIYRVPISSCDELLKYIIDNIYTFGCEARFHWWLNCYSNKMRPTKSVFVSCQPISPIACIHTP